MELWKALEELQLELEKLSLEQYRARDVLPLLQ